MEYRFLIDGEGCFRVESLFHDRVDDPLLTKQKNAALIISRHFCRYFEIIQQSICQQKSKALWDKGLGNLLYRIIRKRVVFCPFAVATPFRTPKRSHLFNTIAWVF